MFESLSYLSLRDFRKSSQNKGVNRGANQEIVYLQTLPTNVLTNPNL